MKRKIVKKDYIHECGDGCCTEFGFEWYVDGEFVYRGSCEDNGLLAILEHLGIEVELVGQSDEGEETWSL